MTDFKASYDRHADQEEQMASRQGDLPSCYSAPDSVDAWRHRRMHEMLDPLLDHAPDATWITLGDGNFGSDAYFLQQRGIDVLASSLTDHSLRIAAEKGYLRNYAAVNAEQVPYGDDSFDYALCKEAYHHFPRPAIAFYEMLRIAKSGVVLIEPYDGPRRLLDIIKGPAKKLLWGKGETIYFEPSGNFIYRIHPREKGKKLAAMGYAAVAHKTFNDIYLPRFGKAKAGRSFGYVATKLAILLQDILSRLGLLSPALITLVAFKQMPPDTLVTAMKRAGFDFDVLPVNPYT
jgi:ubiquinone/menaquinone biosynthesis C-methylase UbiE